LPAVPIARATLRASSPVISTDDGGLVTLPGSCIGTVPPGQPAPVCCISGSVFIDGRAVERAKVTITTPHGIIEEWTRSREDKPLPFYETKLPDVQPGEPVIITAEYGGHSHTINHTSLAGGQRVNVVLPRDQSDD